MAGDTGLTRASIGLYFPDNTCIIGTIGYECQLALFPFCGLSHRSLFFIVIVQLSLICYMFKHL